MESSHRREVAYAECTIKKADRATDKASVKHSPLEPEHPAITVIFHVVEPDWLERLKPNATIRFVADKINGTLTIITRKVVAP